MGSKKSEKKAAIPSVPSLAVGDEVDAKCRKCRDVTRHVVLAKIGWKPTRVECRTCSGTHEFRAPGSFVRDRAAKLAPELGPAEEWRSRMEAAKGEPRPYDRTRGYVVGDFIQHPRFGGGAVVARPSDTIFEVAFETGTVRLLMRSAGPAPSGGPAVAPTAEG